MARESTREKLARAQQIIATLRQVYPDAHCELRYTNPLELLIATILSAQCTDKRVNLVTGELFKSYRSAADYAKANPAELQAAIQSTGFFRNKAKNIQACCRAIVERHAGAVPAGMEELTSLAGVGRKTANVVLGTAFQRNEGIVVDTHVARLSRRLGLTSEQDPVKIEQDLVKLVPRPEWTVFSHWLIWHGRRRCAARKPLCASCEIQALCPSRAN